MSLLLALLAGCAGPPEVPTTVHAGLSLPAAAPRAWPSPAVRVHPLPVPEGRRLPVAIDAGHGTKANRGAISSWGAEECLHTAAFSRVLEAALAPRFTVTQLRGGDPGPSYEARVARADALRARALISLHADARGDVGTWSPRPGETWRIATSSPGFAILWSGRGPLAREREALARSVATHLADAGFLPYDGHDYEGLYETHAVTPGVFRDLRGLYLLRQPSMPSIIVETHNALDPHEVARWSEPGVAEAFASALAAGIAAYLDGS